MNHYIGVLCFATAGLLAVWWLMVRQGFTQDWLPDDLKNARVVMVEKTLYVRQPYKIVGRLDQVYKLSTGEHVPVEGKNRNDCRIYLTDVAQLSLQAWLLRQHGLATAAYGYAAINNRQTGERKAVRVELRSDEFCEALIRRYIDLLDSAVGKASRGAKCKSCGYQQVC